MGYKDNLLYHVLIVSPSDVGSIKKGIIKQTENGAKAPYIILLVGETGAGKSSFLEFIANVLSGRTLDNYDLSILDRNNEPDVPAYQSKTQHARLYELTSKNGIVVSVGIFLNTGVRVTSSQGSCHRHTRISRHSWP